ncbi:MAG: MATE family efflux transporter [Bacteroidota bacterium]
MQQFWQTVLSAIKGKEQDYTQGSINRAIFLLSIPMMIEMFGEGLFAIIDAYFLGKVSNAAAATAGIVEVVATLIYSIGIGIGIAATALVARRIGENKPEAASKAAAQTILLSVGVAIILGIVGVVYAEDILRLMKAEEEVIAVGTNYTRILLGTNVVIILLFVLNGVFRGAGDAFMAMISLWVANLINIILDPLFIFGIGPFPEMGATGAAVATSIGRGLGVAFQLYILFDGKRVIRLSLKYFRLIPALLRKIVNVAATGSLQFFISSASWIFLARLVAAFGTDVYAGYFFAIRLVLFAILPAWGMANATATLVGQNLGAKQADRAATSVWRAAFFNMGFLFLVQVFFFFSAESLIRIFTTSPAAIETGTLTLRIICAGYIFFGLGMVLGQAFGGAGDTRTPTIVNFVCFWLIEIPLAYFLSLQLDWGVRGVLWSIAISETVLAIIFVFLFRRGKWKTVEV